jgi:hypothetical protein
MIWETLNVSPHETDASAKSETPAAKINFGP